MLKRLLSIVVVACVGAFCLTGYLNQYTEGMVPTSGIDQLRVPLSDIWMNASFSIAFGSCDKHHRHQSFWKDVEGWEHYVADSSASSTPPEKIGGMIWLGDVVYADTTYGPGIWVQSSLATMKSKYEALRSDPYYSAFVNQSRHVLGVWDDHDMGCNDGGKNCHVKEAAQQFFLDFVDVPVDSPRRQRKGLYSFEKLSFPPEQRQKREAQQYENAMCVVLLDARYDRDDVREDRTGKILSEEQWSWLEETLRQEVSDTESPAGTTATTETKKKCMMTVIGSGIQVLADEKPTEQWGHFQAERSRLFRLIRQTKSERVVFLSGDVHMAELQVEPNASLSFGGRTEAKTKEEKVQCEEGSAYQVMGYPIIDATASGFTHSLGELLPTSLVNALLPTPRLVMRHLRRNYVILSLHNTPENNEGIFQILFVDVATNTPIFVFREKLSLLSFRQLEASADPRCRDTRGGVAPVLRDAPSTPLRVWLHWIQEHVLPLKTHYLIYSVVFSLIAMILFAILLFGYAASCFLNKEMGQQRVQPSPHVLQKKRQ